MELMRKSDCEKRHVKKKYGYVALSPGEISTLQRKKELAKRTKTLILQREREKKYAEQLRLCHANEKKKQQLLKFYQQKVLYLFLTMEKDAKTAQISVEMEEINEFEVNADVIVSELHGKYKASLAALGLGHRNASEKSSTLAEKACEEAEKRKIDRCMQEDRYLVALADKKKAINEAVLIPQKQKQLNNLVKHEIALQQRKQARLYYEKMKHKQSEMSLEQLNRLLKNRKQKEYVTVEDTNNYETSRCHADISYNYGRSAAIEKIKSKVYAHNVDHPNALNALREAEIKKNEVDIRIETNRRKKEMRDDLAKKRGDKAAEDYQIAKDNQCLIEEGLEKLAKAEKEQQLYRNWIDNKFDSSYPYSSKAGKKDEQEELEKIFESMFLFEPNQAVSTNEIFDSFPSTKQEEDIDDLKISEKREKKKEFSLASNNEMMNTSQRNSQFPLMKYNNTNAVDEPKVQSVGQIRSGALADGESSIQPPEKINRDVSKVAGTFVPSPRNSSVVTVDVDSNKINSEVGKSYTSGGSPAKINKDAVAGSEQCLEKIGEADVIPEAIVGLTDPLPLQEVNNTFENTIRDSHKHENSSSRNLEERIVQESSSSNHADITCDMAPQSSPSQMKKRMKNPDLDREEKNDEDDFDNMETANDFEKLMQRGKVSLQNLSQNDDKEVEERLVETNEGEIEGIDGGGGEFDAMLSKKKAQEDLFLTTTSSEESKSGDLDNAKNNSIMSISSSFLSSAVDSDSVFTGKQSILDQTEHARLKTNKQNSSSSSDNTVKESSSSDNTIGKRHESSVDGSDRVNSSNDEVESPVSTSKLSSNSTTSTTSFLNISTDLDDDDEIIRNVFDEKSEPELSHYPACFDLDSSSSSSSFLSSDQKTIQQFMNLNIPRSKHSTSSSSSSFPQLNRMVLHSTTALNKSQHSANTSQLHIQIEIDQEDRESVSSLSVCSLGDTISSDSSISTCNDFDFNLFEKDCSSSEDSSCSSIHFESEAENKNREENVSNITKNQFTIDPELQQIPLRNPTFNQSNELNENQAINEAVSPVCATFFHEDTRKEIIHNDADNHQFSSMCSTRHRSLNDMDGEEALGRNLCRTHQMEKSFQGKSSQEGNSIQEPESNIQRSFDTMLGENDCSSLHRGYTADDHSSSMKSFADCMNENERYQSSNKIIKSPPTEKSTQEVERNDSLLSSHLDKNDSSKLDEEYTGDDCTRNIHGNYNVSPAVVAKTKDSLLITEKHNFNEDELKEVNKKHENSSSFCFENDINDTVKQRKVLNSDEEEKIELHVPPHSTLANTKIGTENNNKQNIKYFDDEKCKDGHFNNLDLNANNDSLCSAKSAFSSDGKYIENNTEINNNEYQHSLFNSDLVGSTIYEEGDNINRSDVQSKSEEMLSSFGFGLVNTDHKPIPYNIAGKEPAEVMNSQGKCTKDEEESDDFVSFSSKRGEADANNNPFTRNTVFRPNEESDEEVKNNEYQRSLFNSDLVGSSIYEEGNNIIRNDVQSKSEEMLSSFGFGLVNTDHKPIPYDIADKEPGEVMNSQGKCTKDEEKNDNFVSFTSKRGEADANNKPFTRNTVFRPNELNERHAQFGRMFSAENELSASSPPASRVTVPQPYPFISNLPHPIEQEDLAFQNAHLDKVNTTFDSDQLLPYVHKGFEGADELYNDDFVLPPMPYANSNLSIPPAPLNYRSSSSPSPSSSSISSYSTTSSATGKSKRKVHKSDDVGSNDEKLSLQEAMSKKRPSFIKNMQQRQSNIKALAKQRQLERQQKKLSSQRKEKNDNVPVRSKKDIKQEKMLARFSSSTRQKISQKEMKNRSKKNYEKLPEVLQRKRELQMQEQRQMRLEKIRQQDKKRRALARKKKV